MISDAHDCCSCAGKMRKGRHDFRPKVGDEIIVIKDVPALICDTCDEVKYTLGVSREIDLIMKDFSLDVCALSGRRGRSDSCPSAQNRLHERLLLFQTH